MSTALLGVAVVVLVAGGIRFFYYPQTETPVSLLIASSTPSAPATIAAPSRLLIPSLSVNAPVEKVGIIAGNRMAAPTKFSDVAWFKYGTIPGNAGSALIAGHVDNGLGLSGVFKHLNALKVGDEIQIKTEDGALLTFRVAKIASYPYDKVPQEVFTASDHSYVNLISCIGHWIYSQSEGMTFDHRLVVYTVLEGENPST